MQLVVWQTPLQCKPPQKTKQNFHQIQQHKQHCHVTQQPANLLLLDFKYYTGLVSPEGTLNCASSLGKEGSSFTLHKVTELKLSIFLTLFWSSKRSFRWTPCLHQGSPPPGSSTLHVTGQRTCGLHVLTMPFRESLIHRTIQLIRLAYF